MVNGQPEHEFSWRDSMGILDTLSESLDPLKTDLGRARAGLINRQRVR